MEQKIGISVGNFFRTEPEDLIHMVADLGFDAVSPVWSAWLTWIPTSSSILRTNSDLPTHFNFKAPCHFVAGRFLANGAGLCYTRES